MFGNIRASFPGSFLPLNVGYGNNPYWGGIGGAANLHACRRLLNTRKGYPHTSVSLGNIYKKNNGGFGFLVNAGIGPDGKPKRREITAVRKNDLVARRREIARQVATGTYITGTTPTVGQGWTHWCDEIAARRVRPNVLANYRSYGRRHIIPTIGSRRLDAITIDDVRHLHKTMRDGGASTRTVEAVHNKLRKVLDYVVREDKVAVNVCDKMDKPRAVSREREALSAAEVRALITTIQGEPTMWPARWRWGGARNTSGNNRDQPQLRNPRRVAAAG